MPDMPSNNVDTHKTQFKEKKLSDLIDKFYRKNDLKSALLTCKQLNQQHPNFHHGWYLAGFLMARVNNYQDALRAVEQALLLSGLPKYKLLKAQCLFSLNKLSEAKETSVSLQQSTFSSAEQYHDLGLLFNQQGMYREALAEFEKAIALDCSPAAFHFNKAAVLRYLGDVAGAQLSFNEAIKINPKDFEAYLARSNLKKQTEDDNNVDQLRAIIDNDQSFSPATESHQACYALAKELEDLGRHKDSFYYLNLGSNKKREKMQYAVSNDLDIIGRIKDVYRAELFESSIDGCESRDPVFILGMPRTGTTMVERILERHSDVSSAGELNNFALQMMAQVKKSGMSITSRLDLIDKTKSLNFVSLGQDYVNSVQPLRDKKPFFIDKLPFNYLYVGMIHLALPNAKIINLQRNAMDTCYAVYKQLFKDAYPFSYTLEELGNYYIAYHQLMAHWNKVMPGVIHTMEYEKVVSNTENETRKLLKYCNLPWQEQCVQFHKNSSPSTTASATQVRMPGYTSSIGLWHQYEHQLKPLYTILQQAGIETD